MESWLCQSPPSGLVPTSHAHSSAAPHVHGQSLNSAAHETTISATSSSSRARVALPSPTRSFAAPSLPDPAPAHSLAMTLPHMHNEPTSLTSDPATHQPPLTTSPPSRNVVVPSQTPTEPTPDSIPAEAEPHNSHPMLTRVQQGQLRVSHVASSDQLADSLTKPLSKTRFSLLRSKIGVSDIPTILRGRIKDNSV
ncbi:hypothetical protein LWI29_023298 [Acer saccharum]|uniref:Uncharacterized protein n=1 Tax=Acer saccharum TaxID=4024 RepID=A0AA39VM06_ACESA|nr:hypothetical protein LWI29_023298 [Acer saccharum]